MKIYDIYVKAQNKQALSLDEQLIISKDAEYSYNYAKEAIRNRFQLGEAAIAKNHDLASPYLFEVIAVYHKDQLNNVFKELCELNKDLVIYFNRRSYQYFDIDFILSNGFKVDILAFDEYVHIDGNNKIKTLLQLKQISRNIPEIKQVMDNYSFNYSFNVNSQNQTNNQHIYTTHGGLIALIKAYQIKYNKGDKESFDIKQWLSCAYPPEDLDIIFNMINIAGVSLERTDIEQLVSFFEMDLNQKIDMNQYDNNVQLIL